MLASTSAQVFDTATEPKEDLVIGRLDVKVRHARSVDSPRLKFVKAE